LLNVAFKVIIFQGRISLVALLIAALLVVPLLVVPQGPNSLVINSSKVVLTLGYWITGGTTTRATTTRATRS